MKFKQCLCSLLFILSFTSCYEEYMKDFDYSTIGFSSQKPLRTVIADREMTISVGAAIGGKLSVDMNDWAGFTINPELLKNTRFKLLPENYYTLSDNSTMKVSKSTIPVADVTINFTEDFYKDPNTMKEYYALPFQLESSSLDSILVGKETSVVAIKYISTYHGSYYFQGTISKFDNTGNPIGNVEPYKNIDANDVKVLKTISTDVLCLERLGNLPSGVTNEKVLLKMNHDNTITVSTADGGIEIFDGNGTYEYSYDETNLDSKVVLSISYKFKKDGKIYEVKETLTRRQDPYRELRFEEWK